mgnify:CR=1 FL=1
MDTFESTTIAEIVRRIGLIGENPNDTNSFINLFTRKYPGKVEFVSLIADKTGGNLDDIKPESIVLKQLKLEYEFEKPNFVVLIRDSDALESESDKLNDRLTRMYKLGSAVSQNAIYLLCIWEMETLLLADLDPVNNKYGTTLTYPLSPTDPSDLMMKKEPKEFLKVNCGYHQNDCAELFRTLDFEKLKAVKFFNEFVPKFEQRI